MEFMGILLVIWLAISYIKFLLISENESRDKRLLKINKVIVWRCDGNVLWDSISLAARARWMLFLRVWEAVQAVSVRCVGYLPTGHKRTRSIARRWHAEWMSEVKPTMGDAPFWEASQGHSNSDPHYNTASWLPAFITGSKVVHAT